MATNAAMVLAKDVGRKPRELAEAIAEKFAPTIWSARSRLLDQVSSISRSGLPSGCKNFVEQLPQEQDYGRSDIGGGVLVNVEYVSANPTGPMHIGHCRGAVFGDALANLLAFTGFRVTREYYVNDAGAQVDVLARSAYLRYCRLRGREYRRFPRVFIQAII